MSYPYDQGMSYLFLSALIGGLLMYLLGLKSYPRAAEVGRILFFVTALGLALTLAPAAVKLLQGG